MISVDITQCHDLTGPEFQLELEKAKNAIGENVSIVQGDVTSLQDLERLYSKVKAEKGVVDAVVVSAAPSRAGATGADHAGAL